MNFERKKYKDFSRKQLKNRWGVPVLLTFVSFLIVALFYLPDCYRMITSESYKAFFDATYSDFNEYLQAYESLSESSSSTIASLIESIVEAILLLAGLNVYLKMSRSPEKVSFKAFFEGLNNWWKAILCYLYKSLFLFLWTLCFIIPGFIKIYSYSMMEFLIAEFPKVSIPAAMDISKKITNGNKWQIFVMELSFLGWDLLGILSLGIGYLWIKPYKTMTFVNAYHAMLKNALEQGIIKPEDLQ